MMKIIFVLSLFTVATVSAASYGANPCDGKSEGYTFCQDTSTVAKCSYGRAVPTPCSSQAGSKQVCISSGGTAQCTKVLSQCDGKPDGTTFCVGKGGYGSCSNQGTAMSAKDCAESRDEYGNVLTSTCTTVGGKAQCQQTNPKCDGKPDDKPFCDTTKYLATCSNHGAKYSRKDCDTGTCAKVGGTPQCVVPKAECKGKTDGVKFCGSDGSLCVCRKHGTVYKSQPCTKTGGYGAIVHGKCSSDSGTAKCVYDAQPSGPCAGKAPGKYCVGTTQILTCPGNSATNCPAKQSYGVSSPTSCSEYTAGKASCN